MVDRDPIRARSVRCPRCGTRVVWEGNPQRPFCSLSCRLIDLGRWLDENYRISGQAMAGDKTRDHGARDAPS